MRWYEIVSEDDDVVGNAKSSILDMLTPLQSQGVSKITVQQIIQQLQSNPDVNGVDIDAGFVMNALKGVDGLRIERDMDNKGQMTVFMDQATNSRQVDAKQANKDKEHIQKAASNQLGREMKG